MLRAVFRYVLTLVLLLVGIIYAYQHQEQLTPIAALRSVDILTIIGISALGFIAAGITSQLQVKLVSVRLSMTEMLGLSFLTQLVNYIGPTRPGAVAKAIYLKGEKGMSYAVFSALMAINGFLILLLSGVVSLILLLIFWQQTGQMPLDLYIVCLAVVVASFLPFVIPLPSLRDYGVLKQTVNNAINGFRYIRNQKKGLLLVGVSVILQYLASAWLLMATFDILGQDLSITGALMIGIFTIISNLFHLTPSNLGIQELVTAYLSTIVGFEFTTGLLGASLIRAGHIILSVSLAPLLTYMMLRNANLTFADILPRGKLSRPDSTLT